MSSGSNSNKPRRRTSLKSSSHYHPSPFSEDPAKGARRKVQNRLRAILEQYDFQDKSVLDLGCSGGYFSFEVARYAKHVVAVDADEELIKRNQKICRELDTSNVKFESGVISPAFIESLDNFDVTLFLSVVHHIMAASNVYVCNGIDHSGLDYVVKVLTALRARTETLFFEMGQSDEAHEWARCLPEMNPSPDIWIVENLLKPAGFRSVRIIQPPDWQGKTGCVKKFIHHNMASLFVGRQLVSRGLRRLTGYDTRDGRYMFLAGR